VRAFQLLWSTRRLCRLLFSVDPELDELENPQNFDLVKIAKQAVQQMLKKTVKRRQSKRGKELGPNL
jgi:hypothetical protein